uniref:Protein kinase domain-containing protein n=1 Tax=Anisakis simplex TaxID=6269 RepID=A0A0M3JUL2_ANISI
LAAMLSCFEQNSLLRVYIKDPLADVSPLLEANVSSSPLMPDSIKRLAVISSGRSGTVYKSLDLERDRVIAVKCVLIDGSAEMMCEALRETNILRTFSFSIDAMTNHACRPVSTNRWSPTVKPRSFRGIEKGLLDCSSSPFIVKFFGAMLIDSELCLCMEFMDGGSLDRYGKLPSDVLGSVTVSIINGLSFLWSIKVMHRDIKPSNFLVNSQGNVKLSDFGVSKQLDHSVARSFVGTNAYMAPERLFGGPYRICSDIWSMGVSLCEMGVGRFPLADQDEGLSIAVQRVVNGDVDVSCLLQQAELCANFWKSKINLKSLFWLLSSCNKVKCSLYGSCLDCVFPDCEYGTRVSLNCTTKRTCGRQYSLKKETECRYCWQLKSSEYDCVAVGYSWWKALLLSITLGGFGADRFYLGMWKSAIGKLFSFGGLGVWTLLDVILIAVGYVGPADGSLYV